MFKQRVITALILAPLALMAMFYLPLAGFALVFSGAVLLAAWEWSGFCSLQKNSQRIGYVAITALLLALFSYLLPMPYKNALDESSLLSGILIAGNLWWLGAIALVLSFPKSQGVWANKIWLKAIMGWLTLLPAWAAVIFIRGINYDESPFTGGWLICCLFLLVWAADIGGYIVGKPFGKTKLLPTVSPGKTVEGMAGGVALVMLVVTAIAYFNDWPESLPYWYLAALVLTILSVFGDLTESMFKRVAGIKDSGNFLPGHGGILDRIDSLTATAPLYVVMLVIFGGFN